LSQANVYLRQHPADETRQWKNRSRWSIP
jgi:hypothetical protein